MPPLQAAYAETLKPRSPKQNSKKDMACKAMGPQRTHLPPDLAHTTTIYAKNNKLSN